jgi:putative acetyltransferase
MKPEDACNPVAGARENRGAGAIRRARPGEEPQLFAIWEAAVAATHDFVAPADIAFYAALVRERYLPRARVDVAVARDDTPLGFVGIAGNRIEALFVHPDHARCGIGRRLVEHARRNPGWLAAAPSVRALRVDVNEENLPARAFYARMGFEVVGRSRLDACGKPYPILHLACARAAPAP